MKLSWLAGITSAWALSLAGSASAQAVRTSIGPVDRRCAHTVPNGAEVHVDTGEVTLNGNAIDHFDPACAAPGNSANTPAGQAGGNVGGANSDWYQFSWANAVTESGGLKQFNELIVEWTVPANGPPDQSVLYLFPSFQNFTNASTSCPSGGCGTQYSIIQPILEWGYNGISGTGQYWIAQAMEVWYQPGSSASGTIIHGAAAVSPICYVQANDSLTGMVVQQQASPDKWAIYIQDNTNGCYTYNYFWPGSNWPKYNTFQGGVLEGYGNANESTPLCSTCCSDLPSTNGMWFYTYQLCEAGPYWNSCNNAIPSVTWQSFMNDNFLGLPPTTCSWNGGVGTLFGEFGSLLSWQP